MTIPFRGDYVHLRRMPEWRDTLRRNRLFHFDRFVVFADVVNEMAKPNGKVREREREREKKTRVKIEMI